MVLLDDHGLEDAIDQCFCDSVVLENRGEEWESERERVRVRNDGRGGNRREGRLGGNEYYMRLVSGCAAERNGGGSRVC